MDVNKLVTTMSPEIYANLKRALELGKWPDGNRLTTEQKQHCMDMIILYEHHHGVPEHERTGYIAPKKKQGESSCSSRKTDRRDVADEIVRIAQANQVH